MTTPTLVLPFSKVKRLDPRITFTRASTGTYFDYDGILKTAEANKPRFDHKPDTLDSLGLLIEESRTNIGLQSEVLDNANWTKTRTTITANATTAPDGAVTADKIVEDSTASATHVVTCGFSVTSGTAYTASWFFKAAERSEIQLHFSTQFPANSYAIFNFNTAIVEQTGVGLTSAEIVALPNGWYRCSITATASATASCTFTAFLSDGSTITYSGNGTSGLYAWGFQVEAGAWASSYIQTTTVSVTRSADVASMTGANFSSWYNQGEGTVFCEYDFSVNDTSLTKAFTISDGTSSNLLTLMSYKPVNTRSLVQVAYAGATVVNTDSATDIDIVQNEKNKTAIGLKTNDYAISLNGARPVLDVSGSLNSTMTNLNIGSSQSGGSNFMNGHISHLAYFPKRLDDATLAALST